MYGPRVSSKHSHAKRTRSEEHTSELQSRPHLVCRLLLEKKKKHNQSGATKKSATENTDKQIRGCERAVCELAKTASRNLRMHTHRVRLHTHSRSADNAT